MLKDYIDARKGPKLPRRLVPTPVTKPESKTASRKRELEEKLEGVEFKMDRKLAVSSVKGLPLECDREAILCRQGYGLDR
jgi:hypothetical protein